MSQFWCNKPDDGNGIEIFSISVTMLIATFMMEIITVVTEEDHFDNRAEPSFTKFFMEFLDYQDFDSRKHIVGFSIEPCLTWEKLSKRSCCKKLGLFLATKRRVIIDKSHEKQKIFDSLDCPDFDAKIGSMNRYWNLFH